MKTIKKTLFFLTILLICSCKKAEYTTEDYNYNNTHPENSTNKNYSTTELTDTNTASLDEQFKVYKYIYLDGNVTKAETNVLFVNGKKDELQIITDMPNGQSIEINLNNPTSLGIIEGMDSYIYNSTSDENEKVNVFFHNEGEMMGVNFQGKNLIFMNTPKYK